MPRASSILAPLIAIVLATPLVAHADAKEEALVHLGKAMDAHGQNNFELAAKELKLAYELDPNPDFLYAIGQVYVKLERCSDAIPYYQRYLATKPPAQAMVDTKQAIKTCEKQAAPPPPPPEPEPAPVPVASTTTTTAPWYKDTVGGALVLTGVASSVIGLVMYGSAVSDLDAAEEAPSLAEYDDLVDRARSRRTYSVLLVGGGLVLIGAGVARYVLRDGEGRETQRVGLVPVDRGGLVTWGGSF